METSTYENSKLNSTRAEKMDDKTEKSIQVTCWDSDVLSYEIWEYVDSTKEYGAGHLKITALLKDVTSEGNTLIIKNILSETKIYIN